MAKFASRFRTSSLLILCLVGMCGPALSQTEKTVTVRMLDSRTGALIESTHYLVRINHQQDEHGDWIKKSDDGTGILTLPANATDLAIRATYEYATDYYVNCDASKEHATADHAAQPLHWYPIDKILTEGLVAPNQCVGKKVPEKLQVVAKPGEFVFFVRERSALEQFNE